MYGNAVTGIGTVGETKVISKGCESDKTMLWRMDVELSVSLTDGGM